MRHLTGILMFCGLFAACVPAPPAATNTKNTGSSGSTTSCGPVSSRGVCQSPNGTPTVALVCNSGSLKTDDCGARGLVCTVDASAGAMCISSSAKSTNTTTTSSSNTKSNTSSAPTNSKSGGSSTSSTNGTQACGSVTKAGTCSGNTLNWCFNGKLFTQDCTADKGSTCQTSGGSSTCKTADSSAKATAPASTISVPCGDVTDAGTCSGNTLKWCLNGALTTVDCTVDRGYTCNAKSDGSSTCGPKGSDGAACGTSVTYAGSCDHDTLTWCAGGVVATENCKTDENGSVCKAVGGDSNCYPPTATTCADGTTYAGSCSNGSLTWCANGKTMTENCAANENGASCTVVNGDADCRSSGSGSSSSTCADGSTYAGTCSNGVLKWCSGGTPMTDGCAANHAGTTCTVVNDDANCRASSTGTGSSSGCSDGSTYAGSCSGTTLTYCDNGTTSVKNCTSYGDGYTCMKVNGDSDCRAQNGGDCAGIPSGGQCDDDYTYVYCVNNVKQVQHCDLANWICVDSGTQASCASP